MDDQRQIEASSKGDGWHSGGPASATPVDHVWGPSIVIVRGAWDCDCTDAILDGSLFIHLIAAVDIEEAVVEHQSRGKIMSRRHLSAPFLTHRLPAPSRSRCCSSTAVALAVAATTTSSSSSSSTTATATSSLTLPSRFQKRHLRVPSKQHNAARATTSPTTTATATARRPLLRSARQPPQSPPSNLSLPPKASITSSAFPLPASPVLTTPPRRIIVAVTGATGTIYALRLLQLLHALDIETHLIISKWALSTLKHELPAGQNTLATFTALATATHSWRDVSAAPASGSFLHQGMIIVPCSMKTLAAIRTGYTADLIARAADVTLKEGRRLVLVVRETPLSEIHLENMLAVRRAGAVVAPNVPAFYHRPADLEGVIAQGVGRMADWLGVHTEGGFERWGGFNGGGGGGQNAGLGDAAATKEIFPSERLGSGNEE
ncbi:MAG: hypothetical protein M1819_003847 [Sarea resinae]|nr:MAG: hypothetical protein M1819_003847 [Sarea resinae]